MGAVADGGSAGLASGQLPDEDVDDPGAQRWQSWGSMRLVSPWPTIIGGSL